MTQTYNLRSTARAVGYITATNELAMDTGTASAATATDTLTSASQNAFVWTSDANQPNSADWPAASAGDPYQLRIDISAMGSALALSESDFCYRIDSAAITLLETLDAANSSWDSTTGTGLKTITDSTSASAGDVTDRVSVRVFVTTSDTMMNNVITIQNLNTTTPYFKGPWGSVAAARVPRSTPYPQLLPH